MSDSVRLAYSQNGTSKTVDLNVSAVRGAAEPDSVEVFGVTHKLLDGSLARQVAGLRRNIDLGLSVIASAADRRKLVAWWADPNCKIQTNVGAPTIASCAKAAGGSLLASKNYLYAVRAIDCVGGGVATGNAGDVGDTTDAGNKKIVTTWAAVTNARTYAVYRKNFTAGTNWFLIDYTTALSYTDDGTIVDGSGEDLGAGSPPDAVDIINVIPTSETLESTWENEYEGTRSYDIPLCEATIFTDGYFPV